MRAGRQHLGQTSRHPRSSVGGRVATGSSASGSQRRQTAAAVAAHASTRSSRILAS